jgi:hypothetical protein
MTFTNRPSLSYAGCQQRRLGERAFSEGKELSMPQALAIALQELQRQQ